MKQWVQFTQQKPLWHTAQNVIDAVLNENQPDYAVRKALASLNLKGENLYLLAIGKAAWTMANAAYRELGDRIKEGVVITKYQHSQGDIGDFDIYEAGHPTLDENTLKATARALTMADKLTKGDRLLFFISGGGSALFEQSDLALEEYKKLNEALLASGVDIVKTNCVRKHISNVKGGRFALRCAPAQVSSIVLSDVLGDRMDCIASGPSTPDSSTLEEAKEVLEKIGYPIDGTLEKCLERETPKSLDNIEAVIIGSVASLIESAKKELKNLGWHTRFVTDCMEGEAKEEAVRFIENSVKALQDEPGGRYAFIGGGETTVTLNVDENAPYRPKGGRNQEMALVAAKPLSKLKNALFLSLGSDGTDGPTDAAGGIVDSTSLPALEKSGYDLEVCERCHNSYDALKAIDSLIFTGPTGTNINDLTLLLIEK